MIQNDPNFKIARLAMLRMERAPKDSVIYVASRNVYNAAFNRLVWRGYSPNRILRALGVIQEEVKS